MSTPESKVKTAIKRILNQYECLWWMPTGSTFGATGIADFLVLVEGVLFAIEAKAGEKSRRRPMQKRFLAKVNANGGYGMFIHVGNLDNIHRAMTEVGARRAI